VTEEGLCGTLGSDGDVGVYHRTLCRGDGGGSASRAARGVAPQLLARASGPSGWLLAAQAVWDVRGGSAL
jgi:hypothetical protein